MKLEIGKSTLLKLGLSSRAFLNKRRTSLDGAVPVIFTFFPVAGLYSYEICEIFISALFFDMMASTILTETGNLFFSAVLMVPILLLMSLIPDNDCSPKTGRGSLFWAPNRACSEAPL